MKKQTYFEQVYILPLLPFPPQNLIHDIEGHKGKAIFVLEKHAELHATVGEESRLHNTHLAAEINTLLEQAHQDREELREAVQQQEQYEKEMNSLSSSISEAQARLIGSPIQASSVKDLKEQILERNVSNLMLLFVAHCMVLLSHYVFMSLVILLSM